ncbi:hypothetical protein CBR_g5654 [Chara braunii]|uniref:Leucine zipper transcription factor-like protein 1 n=1 Tax=Chara braunii TaxID=69332 RepID=A0A388JRS9_CHABU|nr:hypothetical protein CBR_g5654 [Chara braunii]|eukprot:GBG60480.1 hypothetical protein CBR_g5654 [Chara braunii]
MILRDKTLISNELMTLKDEFQKRTEIMHAEHQAEKDTMERKMEEMQERIKELENAQAVQSKNEDERKGEQKHLWQLQAKASEEAYVEAKKEMEGLKTLLQTRTLEVEDLEKQLATKLNESKQFVTMKKMMQTKTMQLQKLRERLEMYEPPDVVPTADEDAEEEKEKEEELT